MVVKMPEVGRAAEGFGGGGAHFSREDFRIDLIFRTRVIKFGQVDVRKLGSCWIAGKNDVSVTRFLKKSGLRLDDAGDAAGPEVVVDEGDFQFGLNKWLRRGEAR